MPVETAADRLAFFDTDEFGAYCTYTAVGGGTPATIYGHFDSVSIAIDGDGQIAIQTKSPKFVCRVDDLTSGGKEGDTLVFTSGQLSNAGMDTANAGTYLVLNSKPDGTGMTELELRKTS